MTDLAARTRTLQGVSRVKVPVKVCRSLSTFLSLRDRGQPEHDLSETRNITHSMLRRCICTFFACKKRFPVWQFHLSR